MEQLDAEMLKNLDVLIDMDAAETSDEWDLLENMDEVEAAKDEEDGGDK